MNLKVGCNKYDILEWIHTKNRSQRLTNQQQRCNGGWTANSSGFELSSTRVNTENYVLGWKALGPPDNEHVKSHHTRKRWNDRLFDDIGDWNEAIRTREILNTSSEAISTQNYVFYRRGKVRKRRCSYRPKKPRTRQIFKLLPKGSFKLSG